MRLALATIVGMAIAVAIPCLAERVDAPTAVTAESETLQKNSFTLRVLDEAGKPVSKARTRAVLTARGGGWWTKTQIGEANRKGIAKLEVSEGLRKQMGIDKIELFVSAPEYAFATFTMTAAELNASKVIDVKLSRGEVGRLRIAGPDGRPVPSSASVLVQSGNLLGPLSSKEKPFSVAPAKAQGDGGFAFNLPPDAEDLYLLIDVPGMISHYAEGPLKASDLTGPPYQIVLPKAGGIDVTLKADPPMPKDGPPVLATLSLKVGRRSLWIPRSGSPSHDKLEVRVDHTAPGKYSLLYPVQSDGRSTRMETETLLVKPGETLTREIVIDPTKPNAPPSEDAAPRVGEVAPDFALTTLDGTGTFRLSDFRGKIVYIDFWATWCGPCQQPMADNAEIWSRRSGEWKDKVVILAASCDSDAEQLRTWVKDKDWGSLTHGHLSDYDSVRDAYSIDGIPTCLLVDPAGKVVWRGHPARYPLEQEIDKLLKPEIQP
ncbi:redoxin domain-containing protein [bacterium]|nr:redoxin domain-containing protein [bacterium]